VGTVKCAETERKVVVPRLEAYPAQLTASRLVTEVAAVAADAAARAPAPTAFSGVPGRIDPGDRLGADGDAASAEGFPHQLPTFHASKPAGWTIWPASRLLMAATPPQLVERPRR